MENIELINLWKSYGEKLEENLLVNRRNTVDITKIKVQSFLRMMTPLKIFAIIAGILWAGFVDTVLIAVFPAASFFFLISAALQGLLTKAAIGIYLYQLVLIYQVDVSEPILATQERLARLQSTTLLVARLLLLQLPLWTTFYLNNSMLANGNVLLWGIQAVVTLAFTYVAVWLFIHIRYENRHKKWFRWIFRGREWDPLMQSLEMLDQVKDYKEEGAHR